MTKTGSEKSSSHKLKLITNHYCSDNIILSVSPPLLSVYNTCCFGWNHDSYIYYFSEYLRQFPPTVDVESFACGVRPGSEIHQHQCTSCWCDNTKRYLAGPVEPKVFQDTPFCWPLDQCPHSSSLLQKVPLKLLIASYPSLLSLHPELFPSSLLSFHSSRLSASL